MGRMTEKDESGRWQVNGMPWERLREGQAITKETGQILYGCLCKLKAYEDCGMGPDQLEGWKDRLEDVGHTASEEKKILRCAITAMSHIIYLGYCFEKLK